MVAALTADVTRARDRFVVPAVDANQRGEVAARGRVVFADVSIAFPARDGNSNSAVERLDLVIEPGEFAALIGPSGCGKSTLLNVARAWSLPAAGRFPWTALRLPARFRRSE